MQETKITRYGARLSLLAMVKHGNGIGIMYQKKLNDASHPIFLHLKIE